MSTQKMTQKPAEHTFLWLKVEKRPHGQSRKGRDAVGSENGPQPSVEGKQGKALGIEKGEKKKKTTQKTNKQTHTLSHRVPIWGR